ncbi:MAG: hypothetical protein ACREMU_09365, partial [Gemmatimonadaceae bacterium]
DQLQYLDNVLADTPTTSHTRRALLKHAAAGAVALSALGTAGSALAGVRSAGAASADSAKTVLDTAITAEAFAVAFLDELIKRLSKGGALTGKPASTSPLIDVLKAAGAAEFDHFAALKSLGATPLATSIGIPDALFGDGGKATFLNIELAEALFINAYLIGITVFAKAKQDKLARYAGEILGVEAEHRALARYAKNVVAGHSTLTKTNVPNNKGFETYTLKSMSAIVGELEKAGFGFGKQGATPGQFVDFPGNPSKNGTGFYVIAPSPA